jgi:hypothetical protein
LNIAKNYEKSTVYCTKNTCLSVLNNLCLKNFSLRNIFRGLHQRCAQKHNWIYGLSVRVLSPTFNQKWIGMCRQILILIKLPDINSIFGKINLCPSTLS